jgi:tyrosyl-tRNA synthetase
MQKALARDMTERIHSKSDCLAAIDVSEILFGEGTTGTLRRLTEAQIASAFEGVPGAEVPKSDFEKGITALELAADRSGLFGSRGEAKRMIQQGGLSINREKVVDPGATVGVGNLLNGRYVLLQKGRKTFCLVRTV